MRACMCACVRACVRVCVCVCVHAYVCACSVKVLFLGVENTILKNLVLKKKKTEEEIACEKNEAI